MADLFDAFQAIMGRPNPNYQIAAALNPIQAQLAGGGAGVPPGPAGGAPPTAAGGAPVGPGGGSAPPSAPPQPRAYTSPPDLAAMNQQLAQPPNLGQLMVDAYQRQQAHDTFNQSLGMIIAGFGRPRSRGVAENLMNAHSQDPSALFQNLMTLQGYQQQQQQLADFRASAGEIAKSLSASTGATVTPQEVIAMGPDTVKTMLAQNAPTETMKNIAAWERQARASGMSEQDIASTKASMLGASIGGQTPVEKDRRDDIASWRRQNPGKSDAEMLQERPELANNESYLGAKSEQGKQMAIAGEDKIVATNSFGSIEPTMSAAEDNLKWLKDHPDAVVAAIHSPVLTSGVLGQSVGGYVEGDDATRARAKLDWLKKQLYADRFAGTKNLRSNTEANNLGSAASNIDSRTNGPEDIQNEIQRLYDDARRARANLMARAGKEVPAEYSDVVDPTFLIKTLPNGRMNPLYNGATLAPAEKGAAAAGTGGGQSAPAASSGPVTTVKTPADVAKLPKGTRFVIPDGSGRIGIAPGS